MSAFIKRYIKGSITLCVTCVFYIAQPVKAAGFDCAKASTEIEKIICGNAELSKLDGELSGAYIHAFGRSENKKEVVHNQRRWLKDVRNTCHNSECLRKVYEVRIRALTINEWSESTVHGAVLPAPVCARKHPSEYCSWPQEKLMTREKNVIEDVVKKFNKFVFPNLNQTTFVQDVRVDLDTNQKIETYCSAKLSALREGRSNLFPQPKAKSSQVGFQMLKQRREDKAKQESCDRGRGAYAMFDTYTLSDTEWLYELPDGQARLFINPIDGTIRLTAVFDQCNAVVGIEELIASQADTTKAGAGFFTEQALGLVEIEGELFGIEGGAMVMDGDVRHWKDGAYFSVWDKTYDLSKDAAHEIWDVRILTLYPLSSRWAEHYRHTDLSNKACTWIIQD